MLTADAAHLFFLVHQRFIERNHQRMWKFRSNFRNKSPQEMLDTIVNNMHFDGTGLHMHICLRRW